MHGLSNAILPAAKRYTVTFFWCLRLQVYYPDAHVEFPPFRKGSYFLVGPSSQPLLRKHRASGVLLQMGVVCRQPKSRKELEPMVMPRLTSIFSLDSEVIGPCGARVSCRIPKGGFSPEQQRIGQQHSNAVLAGLPHCSNSNTHWLSMPESSAEAAA